MWVEDIDEPQLLEINNEDDLDFVKKINESSE